jgi:predicted transcriptional regulator
MTPTADVIVSIRPVHARDILAGRKTVELRRRFPVEAVVGRLLIIYASAPEQAIIGAARIKAVRRMRVGALWRSFGIRACVEREAFFDYFSDICEGYGVVLGPVAQFKHAIPVSELRERYGFSPPQSYRYVRGQLAKLLEDDRLQIPDRREHRDRPRGQPRGRRRAH